MYEAISYEFNTWVLLCQFSKNEKPVNRHYVWMLFQLWDANTGREFSGFSEHGKRAWSVDFSPVCPTKLASGSDDFSVKFWNINEVWLFCLYKHKFIHVICSWTCGCVHISLKLLLVSHFLWFWDNILVFMIMRQYPVINIEFNFWPKKHRVQVGQKLPISRICQNNKVHTNG